ncbi:MAG: 6-carboxytetrahydropterin synthase [Candidatus Acidiferrales bacterium]
MNLALTRRYRFSASHRLDTPQFSADENRRIYGKCNSPYGHGHNYALEVTITGAVNPETGMIANLADLDPFVEREVIEPFDHKNLNKEVAAFQSLVPTTENVCREIFRRLEKFELARVERVRIEETSKNSFEIVRELEPSEAADTGT